MYRATLRDLTRTGLKKALEPIGAEINRRLQAEANGTKPEKDDREVIETEGVEDGSEEA